MAHLPTPFPLAWLTRPLAQVRILDEDDKGLWQLYETQQKFCRDGRTRPRNKPLAEKKRPREVTGRPSLAVSSSLFSLLSSLFSLLSSLFSLVCSCSCSSSSL
eukprot:2059307-Rhodomonas_salina.1